jgi:hypothetical protein
VKVTNKQRICRKRPFDLAESPDIKHRDIVEKKDCEEALPAASTPWLKAGWLLLLQQERESYHGETLLRRYCVCRPA